ncbi:nucleotidyltransferase domain-containing protein [Actinosynnema sp. NPDC059797]
MTGSPAHQRAPSGLLAELTADDDVLGALLVGSLARGTARPDSDLDVLVVGAPAEDAPWRSAPRDPPVDLLVRTADGWRATFAPRRADDESWGYAFLDGVVLHDPSGVVSRLVFDAAEAHARYRAPEHVRAHHAGFLRHVLPKARAVLRGGDPVEVGWAAAVLTDGLLRAAWAANDLPNPSLDLGTVRRHLDDLTEPAGAPDAVRALLRASPAGSLRRQLDLAELLEPLLRAPVERDARPARSPGVGRAPGGTP